MRLFTILQVALQCKNRMHELVNEEVENAGGEWKHAMERSYMRMDKEVSERSSNVLKPNCRCELQMPQCDAVGSTAVVAVVTPEKIIVSNCGDSRAVLCRNGVAVPLSIDHKVRVQLKGNISFRINLIHGVIFKTPEVLVCAGDEVEARYTLQSPGRKVIHIG